MNDYVVYAGWFEGEVGRQHHLNSGISNVYSIFLEKIFIEKYNPESTNLRIGAKKIDYLVYMMREIIQSEECYFYS